MVSASTPDKDFYAVRPELVLRAADLFAITSSMLERGAKRLHSRAVAIRSGKEAGQWGRHQRPVIEQFCAYTQSAGSDFLLPWCELVEHESRYDGIEGISTRTGNRPLSTVVRVLVHGEAVRRAREMKALTVDALAESCALPPALMRAIETGAWPDVAESTANEVANRLGVPFAELFTPLEADEQRAAESIAETEADPVAVAATTKTSHKTLGATLVILLVAAVAYFGLTDRGGDRRVAEPAALSLAGSMWRVAIELENENIPLPPDERALFENGGYLELIEGGSLGFNWIDPHNLVVLPPVHSWKADGDVLTLVLDGPRYDFDLSANAEELVAFDTTRSFRMTMYRIEFESPKPAADVQ